MCCMLEGQTPGLFLQCEIQCFRQIQNNRNKKLIQSKLTWSCNFTNLFTVPDSVVSLPIISVFVVTGGLYKKYPHILLII
jgi:hypothetical protein